MERKMKFAVIDIIFIALLVLFTIRCYLRGFISEVMSMAAIVLGVLSALFFYKNGGAFLRNKYMPDIKAVPEILAFIALFVIVFVLIKILEKILKEIIEGVRATGTDRFLGILFGLAEGVAVISLILFILRIQPLFDPVPILSDSFFAGILLPLITGIKGSSGV
jgi:membrane protein required for colicin V production